MIPGMPGKCAACEHEDLVAWLAWSWDISQALARQVVDGALAQPGPRSQQAYIDAAARRFLPWWWRAWRSLHPHRQPPPPERPCWHRPPRPPVLELPRPW